MDTIISKNIFLTKNGALTKKSGAQFTRKTVTKFELTKKGAYPILGRAPFVLNFTCFIKFIQLTFPNFNYFSKLYSIYFTPVTHTIIS